MNNDSLIISNPDTSGIRILGGSEFINSNYLSLKCPDTGIFVTEMSAIKNNGKIGIDQCFTGILNNGRISNFDSIEIKHTNETGIMHEGINTVFDNKGTITIDSIQKDGISNKSGGTFNCNSISRLFISNNNYPTNPPFPRSWAIFNTADFTGNGLLTISNFTDAGIYAAFRIFKNTDSLSI